MTLNLLSNRLTWRYRKKDTMNANVLNYEPHLALFVPDNDPLIFYKVIAEKVRRSLRSGRKNYC